MDEALNNPMAGGLYYMELQRFLPIQIILGFYENSKYTTSLL